MAHPLRTIANLIIAIIIGVFSVNIIGVAEVNAAANNGTLKVHEKGTLSGTESNDPKVCTFNFEGFNFDWKQTGYVVISGQGQPDDTAVLTQSFGPANIVGYAATDYINDGGNSPTLANGHYKATLYGKSGNQPNLSDVKAKSKVFKVECLTKTTAVAPTRVDVCGNANDTYTIPSVPGVVYKVGSTIIPAGTYPKTSNSITITAEPDQGYELTGTTSWTLTFTYNTACPITVVPVAPTAQEVCGLNDTFTITATPGVKYYFNGIVELSAGVHQAPHYPFFIKAVATSGYVLDANTQTEWWFNFSTLPCPVTPAAPTFIEECGTANDKYVIPSTPNVRYFVNGVQKLAGTYNGSGVVIITADAINGYYIPFGTQTVWLNKFETKKCAVPCQPLQIRTLSFFNHHHDDEDVPCIPVAVTPIAPTSNDVCGTANDEYTIPTTAGAKYLVNGVETAAGTYKATGAIHITAVALPQYTIANGATASWDITFPDSSACPASKISVVTECSSGNALVSLTNSGNADGYAMVNGSKVIVPQGKTVTATVPYALFQAYTYKSYVTVVDDAGKVLLDAALVDCPLGMGAAGSTPVPTVPLATTASATSPVYELPTTGPTNTALQMLVMVLLAITTYAGTYYWQNRRIVTDNR